MSFLSKPILGAAALGLLASSLGCAAPLAEGPSKNLRLRHVVLYQNGLGYFERTGEMTNERLALKLREREVDDVLKSVVVVEEGLGPNETPATVSALLPRSGRGEGPEEPTELELVFSPRPRHPVSIAYAVPTAAWKATYRIILPTKEQTEKRALLQAWALIDNIGDEDWKDVRVTLATGAPLSYASDLRSPTMMERPELKGVYGPMPGARGPVLAENSVGYDRDADGIPDAQDACPAEPGTVQSDPSRAGCPSHARVLVSESNIQILQQILFEKGGDQIALVSKPILDEIARVLLEHPELSMLELEGHTSNDETGAMDLGMRRASAVRVALIRLGVPASRLLAKSYGGDRPIAANSTDDGRRKNRRVSFRISEPPYASRKNEPTRSAINPESLARVPEAAKNVEASSGTYRYEIANPVTLPKKSSALITLINRPMKGDDVLLYRPDNAAAESAIHPFRAAEIENGSDIGLQPGSVSIFSGGTFVGEGVITRLLPGEKSTIPYAIDNATRVDKTYITLDEPMRIVSLARGVLRVTDRQRFLTTYEIAPGHNVPKVLVLRHPKTAGYEPLALPEGTEKNPEAYLLRVALEPQKTTRVTIEESRPIERQWLVQTTEGEKLALYAKGSSLPPETQKRMDRIIELRKLLAAADDEVDRLRIKRQDAFDRAAELRDSLKAIERTAQAEKLRKMLLERLETVTKLGDELGAKITQRGEDGAMARAELDDAVRDLVIEESKAPERK